MKGIVRGIALILSVAGWTFAAAAGHDHGAHGAQAGQSTAPAASTAFADGVVRKVDRAARKVTVAHGPLPNLQMPAMTMAFRVKDEAWLDQLKPDARIRFVAESVDGILTIVRLEPARP